MLHGSGFVTWDFWHVFELGFKIVLARFDHVPAENLH